MKGENFGIQSSGRGAATQRERRKRAQIEVNWCCGVRLFREFLSSGFYFLVKVGSEDIHGDDRRWGNRKRKFGGEE